MLELAHKIIGKGEEKVILLHDLMGNYKNYEPIFPYLDEEKFTYIFVDLRAYGLSKDLLGEYTCEEASMDISNLLTILNIKEVTIIAHSMSSMIAQKLALIDKRVKKLILVTPISPEGVKLPELAKVKLLKDMQKNESKIEEIVNSSSKRYNQKWREGRIKMAYEASKLEARIAYMKMYLYTNFLQEAKSLELPVRIIVGKNDFALFALENIQKIFTPIYKDLKFSQSNEAGHYPMIETPVYFASKIEEFCSKV